MPEPYPKGRLILIDDDLLSREILSLVADEAGFEAHTFDSGEAALDALASMPAASEEIVAVLADMQMPGICGDSLGRLLRVACGPTVRLVAMSGSDVTPDAIRSYDHFLLKPFSMDDLSALLDQVAAPSTTPEQPGGEDAVLSRTTYEGLAQSMPVKQLHALYTMCLDDAERRIGTMREASAARDGDAYVRSAHAIKGGCGMVGALELAGLASLMEEHGLPNVDDLAPFEEFLSASMRLRRILDARLD